MTSLLEDAIRSTIKCVNEEYERNSREASKLYPYRKPPYPGFFEEICDNLMNIIISFRKYENKEINFDDLIKSFIDNDGRDWLHNIVLYMTVQMAKKYDLLDLAENDDEIKFTYKL